MKTEKFYSLLTKWIITVAAVVLFGTHLFFGSINLDSISLFLLAFAIVPWLGNIFESLELPGGLKFDYRISNAVDEVKRSGLLSDVKSLDAHETAEEEPLYKSLLNEDTNIALAGLRIDLERALRELAEKNNVPFSGQGIGSILNSLRKHSYLTNQQASAINDIVYSLNRAAHGEKVSYDTAQSVMHTGLQLVNSIKSKHKS